MKIKLMQWLVRNVHLLTACVRSVVPFLATFVVVQATKIGFHLDIDKIEAELTVALGTAYSWLARFAESKLHLNFGWLLGIAGPPVYPTDGTPVAGTDDTPVDAVDLTDYEIDADSSGWDTDLPPDVGDDGEDPAVDGAPQA